MNIKVGDIVTGKWIKENREETAVVEKESLINFIENCIARGEFELLKVQRPHYELLDIIDLIPKTLTDDEKQFIKLLSKISANSDDATFRIEIERDKSQWYNTLTIWHSECAGYIHNVDKKYFRALEEGKRYTLKDLNLED